MIQEKISNLLQEILSVENSTLDSIDMSFINKHELYHDVNYFYMNSGREHYRLLSYVSLRIDDNKIFDIGTNKCMSALALSYNKKNKVFSYDIVRLLPSNPEVQNIEFILGDSTESDDIKNSYFIFLDVDHDGIFENKFYNYLNSIGWKGILMLDDIHLNKEMIEFWNSITQEKYDITHKGHWSGTGVVVFG